jgi:hypothetical protein
LRALFYYLIHHRQHRSEDNLVTLMINPSVALLFG